MRFQQIQKQFTLHIRNPDKHPGPNDIEARRLKIYSELLFNNVESFVGRAFPVLKKIYGAENWHKLIRDFFEMHQSKSPYFVDIAEEFLDYLFNERKTENEPPFLQELAHYEWMELVLEVSQEEIPANGFNPNGNLMRETPFFSPLAELLQYQWPVHKISPTFLPKHSEQISFLMIYRTRDYQVKFMELNALSARLIAILQENPACSGSTAVEQLHSELPENLPHLQLPFLLENAEQTLMHLQALDIILGTQIKTG